MIGSGIDASLGRKAPSHPAPGTFVKLVIVVAVLVVVLLLLLEVDVVVLGVGGDNNRVNFEDLNATAIVDQIDPGSIDRIFTNTRHLNSVSFV